MTFRGYFALNGVEIANSSRIAAHLGVDTPTSDLGMFDNDADCSLTPARPNRVVDPGMNDPAVWPVSGSTGDVTLDDHRLRMAGGNGTAAVGYLIGTAIPTADGETFRVKVTVTADPANTADMQVRPRMRYDDTTGVNATGYAYLGNAVLVSPGQTVVIDRTINVLTGYNRARSRVEIPSGSPAAGVIYVTDPLTDRLADEPRWGVTEVAASQAPIAPGRLIYTPADGTRLYGPGIGVVGECWSPENMCFGCRISEAYDDSWPGLAALVDDGIYRPELAPWYTLRAPESGEFGGIKVLDVKGLGPTPISRTVTEMIGPGGAAGPHRDTSRTVTFDAVLIACTSAGLQYGLQWLTCQLRDTSTRTDSVLRYLAAHPGHSAVDPQSLVREVHGVVLTKEPQITDAQAGGGRENQQATMYRVTWEMAVTRPYAYLPQVDLAVNWDEVETQPIQWVHAPDCAEPADCDDLPVLFSDTCVVEKIEVITSPPPNCGGCLPVGLIDTHRFTVPVFAEPYRCRDTAVTLIVRNTGPRQLTLQAHWRLTATNEACEDNLFPLQVAGLPPGAELILDAISGRYWAVYGGRRHRPAYIVSTPSGAPWQPPVIDRRQGWELIVEAPSDSPFEIDMSLADREA